MGEATSLVKRTKDDRKAPTSQADTPTPCSMDSPTHIAAFVGMGGMPGDNVQCGAFVVSLQQAVVLLQIASCLALFVAAHSPSLNLNDILTPFP